MENLYIFKCTDANHALQLYNKGIKNKIVASHNLNHASSRSHAIFSLSVDIVDNSNSGIENVISAKL